MVSHINPIGFRGASLCPWVRMGTTRNPTGIITTGGKKPGKSHGEYSKGGSLRGNVTVPADCAMTRMFKGSTDQGLEVYERRMMADNYVEHPSVMEPLPHL